MSNGELLWQHLYENIHLHVDVTMPVWHIVVAYLVAVYVLSIPGINATPGGDEGPPRLLAWVTAPAWVPIWAAYRILRYMLYLND